MGLFSKKAGGTDLGNLLRVGASQLSHGILGQGKNMIPVASKPETIPTPKPQVQPIAPKLQNMAGGVGAAVEAYAQKTGQTSPVNDAIENGAVGQWFKKNWIFLVFPLTAIVFYLILNAKKLLR